MRKLTLPGLVLAGLLLGASVQAHEGGAHSRGTVQEITSDRIVLSTTEGKVLTIPMTSGTRIMRGNQAIQATDVRPGERVVVHSASRGGKLEATEVRVAESSK